MRWFAFVLVVFLVACQQQQPTHQVPPTSQFELSTAAKSTLRVVSISSGPSLSTGTGIAVAPNVVLTNRHVIENALGQASSRYRLYVWDNAAGFPRPVDAIIASDARVDLAVLYVRGIASVPATFALAPPSQLEQVSALGFPFSTDMTFERLTESVSATTGEITAVNDGPLGDLGPVNLLMHTATLNPGNSGGPLFNSCGEVVGVNTMRGDPSRTSNVFIASSVSEVVPFLRSFGFSPRVSNSLCAAPPAQQRCTNNRNGLDAAMAAEDIEKVDEFIDALPAQCTSLRTDAWRDRNELVAKLEIRALDVNGSWRLADQECSQALSLAFSGMALAGVSAQDVQIERLMGGGNQGVKTRTVQSAANDDTEYHYRVISGRLTVQNLKSNQSWELQRCTG